MGGFLSLESSFLEEEGNKSEDIVNDEHPACVWVSAFCVLSPGRLHSTELDDRIITVGVLWENQEVKLEGRSELADPLLCSRDVGSHLNDCFERVILLHREK